MRQAIFPTAHPEEDEAHVVIAGECDLIIDHREIENAFLGLDEIPRDDAEDGIEIRFGEAGDDGFHRLGIGRGGVGQFAGDADEGMAVDDELGHAVTLVEVGDVGWRRAIKRRSCRI